MADFILVSTPEGTDSHRINIDHISYIKKLASGGWVISVTNGEKIQTHDPIDLNIVNRPTA